MTIDKMTFNKMTFDKMTSDKREWNSRCNVDDVMHFEKRIDAT